MAKKKIDERNLIYYNLEKLDSKINEFQDYLELNPINSIVTKDGAISITLDAQDKLHKELVIQMKVQDFLFNALPILQKLKEGQQNKEKEIRGDNEIGGLFTK